MSSETMYEEYESEENRFKSFFNYPKPHPPVEDLVVAGFFYIGLGEKDTCQCYSCGVKFNNWTSEDNPIEGHKKFRPKCKFIKTYKDSEKSAPANIPYYPTANTTFISNAESEPKNQNVKQIQEPKPGGTNLMYSKLNKPVNHISKEKENLYSSIIGQSTARTEGMNYKMSDHYSPAPSQSQVPTTKPDFRSTLIAFDNPHQQYPTPNNSNYSIFQVQPSGRAEGNQLTGTFPPRELHPSQQSYNPHQQYPTPNNSNYSIFQVQPSGTAEGNQLTGTFPPRELHPSQQSYNPIQQGLSQQSHILTEQPAYGNQQPQPQPYSIHAAATNLYASNVASFQQPSNQLNPRMSNVEYYGGASYGHNPYNSLYEQGLNPRPILLSSVNSVASNTQYNNPNEINIAPGGSMNSQMPQPQPRRFPDQHHHQTSHEVSIPALTQTYPPYQSYPHYTQYPQGNSNYQP